jgi:hypothetical protein
VKKEKESTAAESSDSDRNNQKKKKKSDKKKVDRPEYADLSECDSVGSQYQPSCRVTTDEEGGQPKTERRAKEAAYTKNFYTAPPSIESSVGDESSVDSEVLEEQLESPEESDSEWDELEFVTPTSRGFFPKPMLLGEKPTFDYIEVRDYVFSIRILFLVARTSVKMVKFVGDRSYCLESMLSKGDGRSICQGHRRWIRHIQRRHPGLPIERSRDPRSKRPTKLAEVEGSKPREHRQVHRSYQPRPSDGCPNLL